MSKERELLRRLVHWCWQVGTIPVVLHEEIEELLAQPEQEKTHLLLRNDIVYAAYLRYLETKSD